MYRHGLPVRTTQRIALNTSRRSCSRCGASSLINVRYGVTNSHSSSLTSLGYGFLAMQAVPQHHRESSEHALVVLCMTTRAAHAQAVAKVVEHDSATPLV